MKNEAFLKGISWAASEVKRRRRITVAEAVVRILDEFNIQEPSERILLAQEVRGRIDRRELVRKILAGMTDMASDLYHHQKEPDIAAAVNETMEKYQLLLKSNNLDSVESKSSFRQRICRRLAYRSQAVQRAKKKTKAHPPKRAK